MRQKKIKNILEKNLKIKINKNTNSKLTGLENYDSLKLVKIIIEIESIDKKKISLNKLNKIFKIGDLLKL
jgi:acyl carrier protein|tara:strand:- start:422 stop:631 length:210 start_codon:yes stop_codon:yes gene_type:complete